MKHINTLIGGVESRHALPKPASETRSAQVIKEQSPKLDKSAPLIVEGRSPSRSSDRPYQFNLESGAVTSQLPFVAHGQQAGRSPADSTPLEVMPNVLHSTDSRSRSEYRDESPKFHPKGYGIDWRAA